MAPPEEVSLARRVILASDGGGRKKSLRVRAVRREGVWLVTLPVFGTWCVRHAGRPGEPLDTVLERTADRAARLATRVDGGSEKWSALFVVEGDNS